MPTPIKFKPYYSLRPELPGPSTFCTKDFQCFPTKITVPPPTPLTNHHAALSLPQKPPHRRRRRRPRCPPTPTALLARLRGPADDLPSPSTSTADSSSSADSPHSSGFWRRHPGPTAAEADRGDAEQRALAGPRLIAAGPRARASCSPTGLDRLGARRRCWTHMTAANFCVGHEER
jgi:hypothetical protein